MYSYNRGFVILYIKGIVPNEKVLSRHYTLLTLLHISTRPKP